MKKLSLSQRMILAEFISNFALAWLSFGLIGPIFTNIESISRFLMGLTIALLITFVSLLFAIRLVR